jgi:hypothetical protein
MPRITVENLRQDLSSQLEAPQLPEPRHFTVVREKLVTEAVGEIWQVFGAEAVAVSDMSVVTALTCDT